MLMPIDPALAMSATYPELIDSWDANRVILYHLGLGAGALNTDASELAYVNERYLKVLPVFSVIPGFEAVRPAIQGPGLDYHLSQMLHGEQQLEIHSPLPPAADVVTTPLVEGVYDKKGSALLVLRAETRTTDGVPLCTNRFRLFIRGEGGFGGVEAPARPDWNTDGRLVLETELQTLPQQAAIYRLSGDRNPLHIDPAFAKKAGFDRPILHGLCTWGMVCKALVDRLFAGDPNAISGWEARFVTSVYPGETLLVRAWQQPDAIAVDVVVKERGVQVLGNGVLKVR
jgi:acyl dehydratase